MSPELEILLWRRGLAFDRTLGACKPVDGLTPASVQRIRPACTVFTSEALQLRRQQRQRAAQQAQAPRGLWQRLRALFKVLQRPSTPT